MADFKNLRGRPQLKDGKRTRKIDARFTEAEYVQITNLEKELGISKTELLRMRLLNQADKVIINSKEMIRILDGIGSELGRAGNNINQLARHANTLRLKNSLTPEVISASNNLLEEYIEIQRSLEKSFRMIIRLMGK